MKKRVLSLLLAVAMVVSMLPVTAFAAEGKPDDPHVLTLGAGATQTDGATLYNWITETVGWKTDKHFYAVPVAGGDRIQFTNAAGSNYTGYYPSGDKDAIVPTGEYKIIKMTGTYKWPSYTYTESDCGYIRIEAAKAEDMIVTLKEGVAGNTVTVPTNFYYTTVAANPNLLAEVVTAVADTKEGYDPSKVALNGYTEVLGVGSWDDYTKNVSIGLAYTGHALGTTAKAQLVYDGIIVGEFTIKFIESRPTVTIDDVVGPVDTFEYIDKPDDAGVTDVKANTTFSLSDSNVSKDLVTFAAGNYRFSGSGGTVIGEGETKAVEFTLTLADTAAYIGDTAAVSVNIRNITDVNENGTHDGEEDTYTVQWVNGETTVKSVDSLSGLSVAYDGETPTKASDGAYNYYFAGWDTDGDGEADYEQAASIPVVDSDITAKAVYTAKAIYTVTYDFNGGKDAENNTSVSIPVEVGGATPAAPTNITNGDYKFAGWSPEVAETVTGNVTYEAKWTRDHAVIFMSNGVQYGEGVVVKEGEKVAPPVAPTWDEDHDFVCWMNGEEGMYDFEAPVTESLTLTAWWIDDFNHNNKDDAGEAKYTVTYKDGDNVLKSFENVLVGLDTPTIDNPTKSGWIFDGWSPEVNTTVTEAVTYTAKWLSDTNKNGINDADETFTVTIDEAVEGDAVTVTGADATENGYVYVYDSKGAHEIVITANPVVNNGVSASYVASVTVNGEAKTLTYGNDYSATCGFTAADGDAVVVTFAQAEFVYKEDAVLNYYPGKPGVTNADVYNAKVDSPALPGDFTLQYLARPASSVEISLLGLGLGDIIEGALEAFGKESITISLDDLWLDVNVEDMSGLIKDSVDLNTAVQEQLSAENLKELFAGASFGDIPDIIQEILVIVEDIKNSAMYYGAHNFGYNATDSETVEEIIKITYESEALYIEDQTTIALRDLRDPSYIVTNNENNAFSVMYKDYTDEELAELIGAHAVDADGSKLDGDVTCVTLTESTFEGKSATDNAYELTFKFAGNETHKPSEAVITVTVTKATGKMDIPNVTVTYGDAYNMDPTYALDNQYGLDNEKGECKEITDSLIRFVVGLDVHNLTLDENNKITGLDTRVQLMLPEGMLTDVIEKIPGISEGIKLSALGDSLEKLEGIIDTEALGYLGQALDAISGIAGVGDLTIMVSRDMPTDIGIYLYGAVSTSGNYETMFDVAYLVITPDAEQVYLKWNYPDENGIFTWDLLNNPNFDIGASAFNDEDCNRDSLNIDATEAVHSLFFGVDETGNLVLSLDEIEGADQLSNGAFVQLAFVAEFGNTFYYAVPIARPFIVTPNLAEVKFDDQNNNNAFLFTYNGKAHEVTASVFVDGKKITPAEGELTITYYGVSTNGETLNGTAAPVHAGAYTAVAAYVAKDDKGEVKLVGGAVAAIVIQPAQAEITVDNATVTWSGNSYAVENLIKVVNDVDDDVKYTVITAQLNSEGDVSENGLAGIRGKVNVDFPEKLDAILKQNELLAAGYTEEGINASVLIDALKQAEGLGSETIDRMVAVLEQLPDTAKLTFENNEDLNVSSVGIYLVMGVITDPDYLPAMDFGVLVIAPQMIEGELQFNYVDSNNIFTQALLADMKANDMDLNASAYDKDGEYSAEITGLVKNLFVGTDANGMPVTTDDWTTLTNGVYLQVSYVETELGSVMYFAQPISRTITIVPSLAEVTLDDAVEGVVTGNCKETNVKVTVTVNNQKIEPAEGELTITYTGVDSNGEPWSSTEIPEVAGEYGVVATFVRYNADGSLYAFGGTVGKLVINDHVAETLPGKDATCTETGLTEGKKCSVCGEVLVAQEVIPALGHEMGPWVTIQYPTTYAKGWMRRDCIRIAVCGHSEIQSLDKLTIEVEPNVNNPIITLKYLNDMDHVAYIKGYEDATIRPNNTITRAEVATIFYRLMTDEARAIFETEVNGFSDVNAKDWFNVAVSTLANADIIKDVKNGKFRPNEPITRGELFMMAAQFLQMTGGKLPVIHIPDVADDYWAADEIKLLVYAGLLKGYEDGTIRPDNTLTRAEAITVINRMLKRAITEEALPEVMVTFKDCTVADWFYEAVQEAVNGHDYIRSTDKVEGYDFHYEIWTAVK